MFAAFSQQIGTRCLDKSSPSGAIFKVSWSITMLSIKKTLAASVLATALTMAHGSLPAFALKCPTSVERCELPCRKLGGCSVPSTTTPHIPIPMPCFGKSCGVVDR